MIKILKDNVVDYTVESLTLTIKIGHNKFCLVNIPQNAKVVNEGEFLMLSHGKIIKNFSN